MRRRIFAGPHRARGPRMFLRRNGRRPRGHRIGSFCGVRRTYRWPRSCLGWNAWALGSCAGWREWLGWRRRSARPVAVVAAPRLPGRSGRVGPPGSLDAGPAVDPSVDGQLTINELMPDNVLTVGMTAAPPRPGSRSTIRPGRTFRSVATGSPTTSRRRARRSSPRASSRRRAATSCSGPTEMPRRGQRTSACCSRMQADHSPWLARMDRSSTV